MYFKRHNLGDVQEISYHIRTPLKFKIALMIFGVLIAIVLLEIGMRLGGFAILSFQEYRNMASIKRYGDYRIMCLGESTTQDQYPLFLEEALNKSNMGIKFSVIDKGVKGITSTKIVSQLESDLDNYHPNIVITMMGINDQGGHMPYEAKTSSKIILLLRHLKIYKFARFLWLHSITRAKEVGLYSIKNDNLISGLNKELFDKRPKPNSGEYGRYIELGRRYLKSGQPLEAEESFKKALRLHPKNAEAYRCLWLLYANQQRKDQAEEYLGKAIELEPENMWGFIWLGDFDCSEGEFRKIEAVFKKSIELSPQNDMAHFRLGLFYLDHGAFSKAEESFIKTIELNPKNDNSYGALSLLNKEMGRFELAKSYGEKAEELRSNFYDPVTTRNYHVLKSLLDKRGIKLVCVQYPMRDVQSLKKIFYDEPEGIIFVDSKDVFRDAVTKDGYKEYFRDRFGGDFGHCTEKGNRLLSANIANAILKEVFRK